MAIQTINVGNAPNDGTGDLNRNGWIKANANFAELNQGILDSVPLSQVGVAGGVAGLDVNTGKVPLLQLPDDVIDVIEVGAHADLPTPGVPSTIYIVLIDTDGRNNVQYRWNGSGYDPLIASAGTTDNVPEGTTNLYFTDQRVQDALTADPAAMRDALEVYSKTEIDTQHDATATAVTQEIADAVSNRLIVYPADAIPTADEGDVYVTGLGPMQWNGSRYVMAQHDHGQCQFGFVTQTECRLFPYNGNGLIINGRQYRIPVAGVSIPNSGMVASTLYYVFAADDGAGSLKLEAATAVAHSKHTDGVEIKTGDPTRTLVGMVYATSGTIFQDDQTTRGVASWFNRRPRSTVTVFTGGPTASTTFVEVSRSNLLSWAREDVLVSGAGTTVAAVVNTGILVRLSLGTSVQYSGGVTQATPGGSATWAWHRSMPPGLFTADDLRVLTGAIATNNAANTVSMTNGLLTMTSEI